MAGAAQALQRASAEAAAGILDPATGAGMLAGLRRGGAGRDGGQRPDGLPDAVPRGPRRPLPDRPAPAPGHAPRDREPVRRRGRVLDPDDGRPRRAGHRPGRRDRPGAVGRAGPRTRARTPGGRCCAAAPTRSIQSRPTAVNLGWAVDRMMARYEQIGDLSDDGGAIADAMRAEADAIVLEATTDHGRHGRVRARRAAAARGPAAPDPDPLQHRAAGLRPVRDGPRHRPGRPPRGPPDPRLGRRDAAVPAGRPAHGLGARPGRRAAHADPRHGRRAPDGPRRGRRGPRRGGPGRGERRHRQQGRHVHRWPSWRPATASRSSSARRRASIDLDDARRGGASRSRSARPRRSPPIRGVADRAARDRGPQPVLRRDAGRADHRDRHRGGRRPRRRSRTASARPRAAAIARWTALPGHDRPARTPPEPAVAAG